MNEMKPSLIIGGASKSGTTAIYYYLLQHPEICLSAKKELHFFSRPWLKQAAAGPGDRFVLAEIPNSLEAYLSFFANCDQAKVAIDISPSYLFHYQSADEMKKCLGEVRIVFILRNPVDKAFSQYMHLVGEGREKLSFEEALDIEDTRETDGYSDIWLYKKSGFYADAINHYIKVLGDENVRVFYYEQLLRDPVLVLREICAFAGVSDEFEFVKVSDINRSGRPKSAFVAKLIAPNAFTYLLRRIVPRGLGRVVRKLFKDLNTGEKPSLDDELRSALMAIFAEDIRKVESFVGRSSVWIK